MSTVMIRQITIEDYDKVYGLWTNTPGIGLHEIDDSRDGIAKYLLRNSDTCFVAEDEGEIVGSIMCGHDSRRGFIYHTAVKEAMRGQGIGKELVRRAVDSLAELGISKVALVTFANNEIGNAFWEGQGFLSREDVVYRNRVLS